ncbi:NAD(P)H-dependent oxidoreductase [Microbacterium invictum]|uniref:FMN reductase n=1 Tax=Microbacterium invictum TaxID=515415 RepID=A0AA40VNI3_9MICO|nr:MULTISPECIES: NAD(P)H-dependent oxidoreductase [Microbacterium]MBB4141404.1 FMN reductase [Microbacterium invictum]
MTLRVVAVSGSLRSPSTTELLLEGILDEIATHVAIERELIELHTLAVDLAVTLTRGVRSDAVTAALDTVSAADVLVIATPIYRGSYTGLFKQFIDVLHQDAIAGTPVLLAAGGGNDQHSLAIDHELRPLFAFFRAHTLPVGVYARAVDFEAAEGAPSGKRIAPDGALPAVITRAVEAALPTLRAIAS